jgi:short-subunit dehydrogenase
MTYMKQFAGKNILLTGASGTIGANIARKLMKTDFGQLVMFVRRDDVMDSKTKMKLSNSPTAHVEEIDFREPQRIE